MADENVDLQFLAEQGKRILAELSEARSERAESESATQSAIRLSMRFPSESLLYWQT